MLGVSPHAGNPPHQPARQGRPGDSSRAFDVVRWAAPTRGDRQEGERHRRTGADSESRLQVSDHASSHHEIAKSIRNVPGGRVVSEQDLLSAEDGSGLRRVVGDPYTGRPHNRLEPRQKSVQLLQVSATGGHQQKVLGAAQEQEGATRMGPAAYPWPVPRPQTHSAVRSDP